MRPRAGAGRQRWRRSTASVMAELARGAFVDRTPRAGGLGRGVTPAAQFLIAPPCTSPEQEAVCRLHHEIDADTPGQEITPPEWRWTEGKIDAHIAVDGDSPVDACRCTLRFATMMVKDLLR